MKLVGWKTKHRAFLAACLFAGMALVARADSDLTANGKKVEVKGVIVSRSGDFVKVQEKKSGEVVLVKLGDNTIIERDRGLHLFFRHRDMDVTALVPGLTIEAEGVGNLEAQLEATKVKFNPDVFAVEVAEEQQVQANKAAVGQAQTTADQGVTNAAAAQTSANQAQSSANQAQSSADQGVATAVAAGIAACQEIVALGRAKVALALFLAHRTQAEGNLVLTQQLLAAIKIELVLALVDHDPIGRRDVFAVRYLPASKRRRCCQQQEYTEKKTATSIDHIENYTDGPHA